MFIEAEDDGSSGDSWSYRSCKAPVKSSPPTNQHQVFFTGRMPFLSPNQQCQSTEWKISHSMDLLTPSSPGVFQLCLWPQIAPGYLGGGLPCLSSVLWCQYPSIMYIKCLYSQNSVDRWHMGHGKKLHFGGNSDHVASYVCMYVNARMTV